MTMLIRMTLFATALLSLVHQHKAQLSCSNGTTLLPRAGNFSCFAVYLEAGKVSYDEALDHCHSHFPISDVVYVDSKDKLDAILTWAIEQGLPTDSQSGFWTGYIRSVPAPLSANGTLGEIEKKVRLDSSRFHLARSSDFIADPSLWRNESQPGNALDERDETCTAQSRPGKQPEFLGIDDYECNGTTLHYVVCQIPNF
ncbi:uncharacterized protein LOC142348674 isoform X1 [Convolutriloba macropyga]|uniref:uncharacterized protein LOC142348674 isoform X1 n=1 Tax=Convolutriloba macropyga TaxID=536237 RepID=UPI003F527821